MRKGNPLMSRKLWISIGAICAVVAVTAIQAWQGFADFDKVLGAIVVLGGGGALLQYNIDKQNTSDG